MAFIDKYVKSVNSSDLRDDQFHHTTDALAASAMADTHGIGALLARVKYTNGVPRKEFESGSANLAQLIRIWGMIVAEKGRSRGWVRTNTAWDMHAAHTLYRRVAEKSLMHWLDGRCVDCNGVGIHLSQYKCQTCNGSGKSEIECGGFEREKILDMINELESMVLSYNARAATLLRKVA